MHIRSVRRSWISVKKITPGYWYCRSMMKIFLGYPCTEAAIIAPSLKYPHPELSEIQSLGRRNPGTRAARRRNRKAMFHLRSHRKKTGQRIYLPERPSGQPLPERCPKPGPQMPGKLPEKQQTKLISGRNASYI